MDDGADPTSENRLHSIGARVCSQSASPSELKTRSKIRAMPQTSMPPTFAIAQNDKIHFAQAASARLGESHGACSSPRPGPSSNTLLQDSSAIQVQIIRWDLSSAEGAGQSRRRATRSTCATTEIAQQLHLCSDHSSGMRINCWRELIDHLFGFGGRTAPSIRRAHPARPR